LADLNAAIALIPDFANSYIYRGIVWSELREHDRAIADLEYAKRLRPDDPLILNCLCGKRRARQSDTEF